MLAPPQKLSEVKAWIASHGNNAGAMRALAWAPRRKNAVHDACIRALMTIGGPPALDALATYRGRDAGDMADLGAAWDRFDRGEFARRVLQSPVVLGARGGLRRIDGIECVEDLDTLSIETAARCPLEPLARCDKLLSLEIMARGDLDLGPIASLPDLDRLVIHGGEQLATFAPLKGARMHKLGIGLGPAASLGFLAELPRLRRVQMSSPRPALSDEDLKVLRRLVKSGVAICGYQHEPWTAALAHVGGRFAEAAGFRAVGDEDLGPSLPSGNFLG
jgi:hypothetical protein